jgi:hypothetical protein
LCEQRVEGLVSVDLKPDLQEGGAKNRGFGFLEFQSHQVAGRALRYLTSPKFRLQPGAKYRTKTKWAEPMKPVDKTAAEQVKAVFVEVMPLGWDEAKLRSRFSQYGEVEGVTLAEQLTGAKRKNFAFVTFAERHAAVAAVAGAHGQPAGGDDDGGGESCVLQVRTAAPPAACVVLSLPRSRTESIGFNMDVPRPLIREERMRAGGTAGDVGKAAIRAQGEEPARWPQGW